jgi:hypothetical protein
VISGDAEGLFKLNNFKVDNPQSSSQPNGFNHQLLNSNLTECLTNRTPGFKPDLQALGEIDKFLLAQVSLSSLCTKTFWVLALFAKIDIGQNIPHPGKL